MAIIIPYRSLALCIFCCLASTINAVPASRINRLIAPPEAVPVREEPANDTTSSTRPVCVDARYWLRDGLVESDCSIIAHTFYASIQAKEYYQYEFIDYNSRMRPHTHLPTFVMVPLKWSFGTSDLFDHNQVQMKFLAD